MKSKREDLVLRLARIGGGRLRVAVDFRSLPASAESLDELHGGEQAQLAQLRGFLFVLEDVALRVDHLEEICESFFIAGRGNIQGLARRIYSFVLRGLLIFENAKPGESILDFLKSHEHLLAVVGDGLVISGARARVICGNAAARIEGLRSARGNGPDRTRDIEKLEEIVAQVSGAGGQIQRGEICGASYADLRVCGSHLALGLRHVGPPLEKIGWQARGNGRRLEVVGFFRYGKYRGGLSD